MIDERMVYERLDDAHGTPITSTVVCIQTASMTRFENVSNLEQLLLSHITQLNYRIDILQRMASYMYGCVMYTHHPDLQFVRSLT